tara:strand:+ start:96 stop:392 length:297 start_codon:yes stop_codon:yes gene_type:complete
MEDTLKYFANSLEKARKDNARKVRIIATEDTLEYFASSLEKARKDNARKVPVRIIDNKTDDIIVWMTPEERDNYMRLHKRIGVKSKIRNVLHGNGRPM